MRFSNYIIKEQIAYDNFVKMYLQSKMLSVMQGEQYLHHLVSDVDCMQQTNELKVGMCKTFQYSQGKFYGTMVC